MVCNSFNLTNEYLRRFHLKGEGRSVFAFDKLDVKVRKERIEDLHLDLFSNISSEVSYEIEDSIDDLISFSDLDILVKRDLEGLSLLLSSELNRNQEKMASEDLRKMTWTLWENTTSFPFWTSDNPVIIQTPVRNGARDRNSIIYFPLNPRLCLVLYGQHLELNLVGKARNRNLYRILGDQESFIKQQNSLQLGHCHKIVVSNVDDFRYARKLVRN